METRKNPKADLNRKTGLFFNIGLVISLLLVITAFEWRFTETKITVDLYDTQDNFEDLLEIPPTEFPPPPPPKIKQPKLIEVPDDEKIDEDIPISIDVEVREEDIIEEYIYEEPEKEETEEIFTFVENQPEPKGGMAAFYAYLKKNLNYPDKARRLGIEGKVFLQFVVDKNGAISDVRVIKGIGAGCDEEAVRVLKNAPEWNPGKQRGKPVKVRMVMPVLFKIG